MVSEESIQLAAQCWCDPRTANRVMDVELATVFAERIDALSRAAVAGCDLRECVQANPNYIKECCAAYDAAVSGETPGVPQSAHPCCDLDRVVSLPLSVIDSRLSKIEERLDELQDCHNAFVDKIDERLAALESGSE